MRKLALFSGAFAAAAAVFVYLFRDVRVLWIAGACLVLSPIALWLGAKRFCAVFLGLCAGFLWCSGYEQLVLSPLDTLIGTEQTLAVVLREDPVETDYGSRAIGQLQYCGKTYQAALYGGEDLLAAEAGDTVTAGMEIKQTGLKIEDGESLYLRSDGIPLCLVIKSETKIADGVPGRIVRLRQQLQDRIHALYTGDAAGLLRALLTGDRSELCYAVQNDLSVAGLSHVVAVSGMHVSMLMATLALLCGYNPRLTALIGIPMVLVFVIMTGLSPSACRAAVMQTMLLCAPLVHREQDGITNLAAAALVLLLQNPWSIASVSFQLSFAAVLGLIVLGRPLRQGMEKLRKKPGPVWRYISMKASATISATMATLPLTVFYFGLISVSALVTNLLVLWAVTAMFLLGTLSCLLGGLGTLLAVPVSLLSSVILGVSRWVASFPYAAAFPNNLPLMIWTAAAYALLCVLLLNKKRYSLPLCSAMTALLLGCILWGRYDLLRGDPVCRVLDVGQGQAAIWEYDGFTAVLDCGGQYPQESGEQVVRTLHSGGQTHVDMVAVTHYDRDHAGGVPQILYRVDVGLLVMPEVPDEEGLKEEILQAADSVGCPVVMVSDRTELTFSGGKITAFPPIIREFDNNSGICILASAEEYDILVTGDLDRFMEMRLISRCGLPQAELLVAGHHGADDSTGSVLLETVRPQIVAISVGEGNCYGHPSPDTLNRIRENGAEVYRTDLGGTLIFRK